MWNINAPQGRIPCAIFTKFAEYNVGIGLGQGHIVLHWDPAPPPHKGGTSQHFSGYVYCGQTAGWIKMPLGMELGLGPCQIVLDGDSAPATPAKGAQQPRPSFRPMPIVATVANLSYC